MAGWISNVCPHCGTTVDHGNHRRHERACLANPTVRANVLQALTDPDDPTRGVSAQRYNARNSMFGAPCGNTLLSRLGTWAAVCAAVGLLEPLPYTQKCAIIPPQACPHCGEMIEYHNRTKHANTCVRNPAVRDAVLSCLRDPQNADNALSAERYNARRVMFDAPSDRALVMQYDGKWESVYTDFGLLRPLVYNRKTNKVCCKHCDTEFTSNVFDRHSAVCPKNPAYYDAIRATLQDDDYPEYAVAIDVYQERAKTADVAGVDILKRTFGAWRIVVAHFGLKPADSAELQQQRAMMAVLALAAKEARLLREEQEAKQGLFVGDDDPRKPNYKPPIVLPAPGLYVNGKPCQRIVLR